MLLVGFCVVPQSLGFHIRHVLDFVLDFVFRYTFVTYLLQLTYKISHAFPELHEIPPLKCCRDPPGFVDNKSFTRLLWKTCGAHFFKLTDHTAM